MKPFPSASLLIGLLLLAALVACDDGQTATNRRKRQAPNINVHQIPKTSFSCNDKKIGEYYADTEAGCQVYHVCIPGMHNKLSLMSFVCPNGTIFNQATRVCSPYDRVDCSLALKFYNTLHGNLNSRRTDYEGDNDYDNYVPPAPRAPAQTPRQSAPRQPAAPARPQQPPAGSRNTIAPPQPEDPSQPARGTSRFRSGANQFRGPQSRATQAQTPAPSRQAVAPLPAVRQPATAGSPPRQAGAAARPNIPGFRSPGTQAPAAAPARPTVRSAVSSSTANYNYEYEYEYDYEDELPDQGNARSKRDTSLSTYTGDYSAEGLDIERQPQKTSFSCIDKVPGGVYADIETDCEMFHICIPLSKHKMLDYKVYCANNTAFDQETGSCQEKTEFKCEKAQLFYQFDKLNQPASGKKPVYKKSSYSKLSKTSAMHKA